MAVETKIEIKAVNKTEQALAQITASLGRMETATERTNKDLSKMNKITGKMKGSFGGLKTALGGLAGAFAFKEFVDFGATFERSITKINAVGEASGATEKDLKGLRGAIDEIGSTTAFTQSEVAEVAFGLLTLGDSAETASSKLGTIVNLAGATGTEMGIVSESVTAMQSIFGVTADTVANQFAGAFLSSSANVERMSEGLSVSGSTAQAMGVSFEDTVAVLSLLNDKTIKGAEAGTAFRNILSLITSQTSEASTQLEKIGLSTDSFRTKSGDLKSVDEIFKTLSTSLDGVAGNAEKAEIIKKVFGAETLSGVNSVLSAFKANENVLDDYRKKIVKTGDAQALYSTMTDDVKGKMESLGSAIQSKLIVAYESISPILKELIERSTAFVSGFDNQTIADTILDVAESVIIFASGAVSFLENLFEAGKKTAQFFGLIDEGDGGKEEIDEDSVAGKALALISEQRNKLKEITEEQENAEIVGSKNLKIAEEVAKAEEKRAKAVKITNDDLAIQADQVKELSPNFDTLLQEQIDGFDDMEKVAIVKFLEQNDAVQNHFEDMKQIEEGNLEQITERFGDAFEVMIEETDHGLDRIKKRHFNALIAIEDTTNAITDSLKLIWADHFLNVQKLTTDGSQALEHEWQIGLDNVKTNTAEGFKSINGAVYGGFFDEGQIISTFKKGLDQLRQDSEFTFKDLDLVITPTVDMTNLDKITGKFGDIFSKVSYMIEGRGGAVDKFQGLFNEISDGVGSNVNNGIRGSFQTLFSEIAGKIIYLNALFDSTPSETARTSRSLSGNNQNIEVSVYTDLEGQFKIPMELVKASINEQSRRNGLNLEIR